MYICRSIQIICVLIKLNASGAATIADQPRINRDPHGVNRGRVLSYATLFCAENRQNIATACYSYISQYFETWREPGTTQAALTIAEQSRINREPIADFIDIF